MFFLHKKEKNIENDIKEMSAKGMQETDIIKELKSKGYNYKEIEKGMMQAIKGGVLTEKKEEKKEPVPQFYSTTAGLGEQPPPQQPTDNLEQALSTASGESPEPVPDLSAGVDEYGDSAEILEELIEGVVEEKWKKIDDQIKKLNKDFLILRDNLREKINKIQIPKANDNTELKNELKNLTERMDDIEARIGAMEKTFKQVLPSMTQNIQKLQELVENKEENPRKGLYQEVEASGFEEQKDSTDGKNE